MKGANAARRWIRVAVPEATYSNRTCPSSRTRCFGTSAMVASRLLRIPRQRGALWFGLDHAAELAAYEQAIIHEPRYGLEFAHRHAQSGAKVYFSLGLDLPPGFDKPPVDQRPGFVLGMEGRSTHDQLLGEPW